MDTKDRLRQATIAVLVDGGLAAASARTIADRADVNQALVFYHFGSVTGLVADAARHAVDAAVARHRPALQQATSLRGLLAIGRELDAVEGAAGNVAVMAQVLAGGRHDPTLAEAGRYGMAAWRTEIATVLHRLLDGHPFAGLVDVEPLAGAVSAAFIGVELYDGVDADAAAASLASLETLAALLDVVDDLGPVAGAAVRQAVRAASRRATP